MEFSNEAAHGALIGPQQWTALVLMAAIISVRQIAALGLRSAPAASPTAPRQRPPAP